MGAGPGWVQVGRGAEGLEAQPFAAVAIIFAVTRLAPFEHGQIQITVAIEVRQGVAADPLRGFFGDPLLRTQLTAPEVGLVVPGISSSRLASIRG